MNPKISITVDAKNKAVATITGLATVGSEIDIEVRGLVANDIESWAATDKFVGKALRFRIVDCLGRDLVRFPIVEKSTTSGATDGDQWQVTQESGADVFKSHNGTSSSPADFNTDVLRKAFRSVSYDETLEFGLILDSVVDKIQYAIGKIKIRQWSSASSDDPTVLPDWRETLADLNTALGQISTAATTASTAATSAQTAQAAAESARDMAGTYSTSAHDYRDEAISQANTATTKATAAAASATAASGYADAAAASVENYPYIHETTKHWMVYDAENETFADTGVLAEGAKGDQGDNGITPHIGQNGNWFIGTTDTGVHAQGPAGTTTWSGITGKPDTFAPSAHTHAQADVTGLAAALAAKVSTSAVGSANGVCPLTSGGKVHSNYLPTPVTTHINNTDVHCTEEQKEVWNGKASKPTMGTLSANSSLDDAIAAINTLIQQLKG